MRNKILLIEDDLGLAIPLTDFFEDNGLDVLHTATGEEGLSLYMEKAPDLIVLDIILPAKSGFEVIAEIRDKDLQTPVILMTGTEFSPESEIKGYALGAINYMRKPVLPQAMLSLIRHILSLSGDIRQYDLAGCRIRIQAQRVEIGTEKHLVREKDALLLSFLLERKNQTVTRTALLKQIWQDDHPDKNNLLDGTVLRVRGLFKGHPHIRIKTIYGHGYMLEEKSSGD